MYTLKNIKKGFLRVTRCQAGDIAVKVLGFDFAIRVRRTLTNAQFQRLCENGEVKVKVLKMDIWD